MSIRYISNVHIYTYEKDLVKLLEQINPDVRFLGDDYRGKEFTGDDLDIPIHFLNRGHGWSTTKLKTLIYEEIKAKND
jgi:glycerol-3-phosphate cytidylyltransferase